MKRATPKSPVQYLLKIASILNEQDGKHTTRFTLETTQSFASFVYDLSVQEQVKDNQIVLKVEGLKPPQLSIPASGHARFEREYENLDGGYDIVVKSIDGKTNSFTVRMASGKVQLIQAPKNGFVDIIIETT